VKFLCLIVITFLRQAVGMHDGQLYKFEPTITAVAATSDGDIVVIGSSDGSVRFIDTQERQTTCYKAPEFPITALGIKKHIAIGSRTGVVLIFDHEMNEVQKLVGHKAPIKTVALGESLIATVSDDAVVKIWKLLRVNLL